VAELETVAKNRFEIIYEGGLFGEDLLDRVRLDGVDVVISFPDTFAELASDPGLVDLSEFVNPRSLRRDYGDYLIDLASVDGAPVGGPIQAQLKTLVWYKPTAFAAMGYAVPETFAELVALSDSMVADGETPWCNYIFSSGATGWVGTDWVEDLLLGTEGPEVYDQWIDHTVVFQDPRVETAFERYQQMIDTPGYVFDRANMLNVFFDENAFPLGFEDCLMHKQGDFFAGILGFYGFDLDEFSTFKFPSVEPEFADAAMGGATWVAALNERKEVRQLVRFMLSQRFGREAIAELGVWILPNVRFDTSRYTNELTRSFGEDVQAALRANQFRFDASDLMPFPVCCGSFWQGIVDLVSGAKTIPDVLADIDASWPMP
jgi:alpha-glucoside transport system substrate-binding protein